MINQRVVEVFVGLFMLIGAIAFIFLALKVSGLTNYSNSGEYLVHARFNNVGDLKKNAPVTIAGVKVGSVHNIVLDKTTFQADVQLSLYKDVDDLPVDTEASILTAGLLGSNYISLSPGYQNKILRNGDTLLKTNPALILENLIGQFIYKVSEGGKS